MTRGFAKLKLRRTHLSGEDSMTANNGLQATPRERRAPEAGRFMP
jgi:hypothetical protein